MRKINTLLACAALGAAPTFAQSAIDGFRFSQTDIKGTARFMGMGGAFGALGADLTTLSYNPAGIGVYRSSDIGFTLNLDCQNSSANSGGLKTDATSTKFLLNNIGGVATFRLNNSVLPNFNIGFTYNKSVSFNSSTRGAVPQLHNSITNYMAGVANSNNLTVGDLEWTSSFDPYYPSDGGIAAPWMDVLGYDSYFITPTGDPDYPVWEGQFGDDTTGQGQFNEIIEGAVNEYNIALGGNFANIVFWGMDFGITNLDYNLYSRWGEKMQNAYVDTGSGVVKQMNANIALDNNYWASGNGFNYKLGVIVKPVQELRLGFAFHTPTWYSVTENYNAKTGFVYDNATRFTSAETPAGENSYNFRTPWRFIASAAGVIGGRLIVSADYDWQSYQYMQFSAYNPSSGWNDWGGGWWDDPWYWGLPAAGSADTGTRAGINNEYRGPFSETNSDIKEYYRSSGTLRIGAEFRITPRFSARAGYAYTSSPVKAKARDDQEIIQTSGTLTQYSFDDATHYVSCGLGYNFKSFYIDAAYMYKTRKSVWHAYTPDPDSKFVSPSAKVSNNNNQIVLSMGFKF